MQYVAGSLPSKWVADVTATDSINIGYNSSVRHYLARATICHIYTYIKRSKTINIIKKHVGPLPSLTRNSGMSTHSRSRGRVRRQRPERVSQTATRRKLFRHPAAPTHIEKPPTKFISRASDRVAPASRPTASPSRLSAATPRTPSGAATTAVRRPTASVMGLTGRSRRLTAGCTRSVKRSSPSINSSRKACRG